MAIRIPLETMKQIFEGVNAVAKQRPLIGVELSIFESSSAVVVDLEFLVDKGIDRGPVCVEVAKVFSAIVPIGKFPSFSIQEFDTLLKQNGYSGTQCPMHVGLFIQIENVDRSPLIDDTNYVRSQRREPPPASRMTDLSTLSRVEGWLSSGEFIDTDK